MKNFLIFNLIFSDESKFKILQSDSNKKNSNEEIFVSYNKFKEIIS